MFSAYGTVESARVITDKFTGQSRGFGFVEMSSGSEAQAAISGLNGTQCDGRRLDVNEAKPQANRNDNLIERQLLSPIEHFWKTSSNRSHEISPETVGSRST
jgi:RNA recognition motif-containing protein